jgi:2-methylcitrate dehydratase PrpD
MSARDRGPAIARRTLLAGAGGLAAAAPALAQTDVTAPPKRDQALPDLTGRLARYMVAARDRPLPDKVVLDAKHRILDTLGAIISGTTLPPGQAGARYVRMLGGTPLASVLGSNIRTTLINAAFANGMSAHADETDDFDPLTKAHPGCSIVPAAFALAEHENRSGAELITAVTLGYDLCCRLLLALDADLVRATHRSAEAVGSSFGAVGAAASLARLDETGMRYALSYASQQVSGLWSWERDTDHIEKAFDFAGMGARNGVQAVTMVQAGFTGVSDVLDGEQNLLVALSSNPHPEQMVAGLGSRFFVSETAIKVFSVGYPIQAALDAFLKLRRQYKLTPDAVKAIVVRLAPDGAGIVDNSAMPDVNLQHLVAVALIDGTVSFEMSHSRERMQDPAVLAARAKVKLVGDKALATKEAPRAGQVEVTLTDGRVVSELTKFPPGTKENPLDTAGVAEKAHNLIAPVLGEARTKAVIAQVTSLERQKSVRELIALMTSRPAARRPKR